MVIEPTGERATVRMIAEYLGSHDIPISRAKWADMLTGTRHFVDGPILLAKIADFFEVEPSYLVAGGGAGVPDKVKSALQYVRAEVLGEVRLFAGRKLGDISPALLETLTAILNEAAEQFGKDQKI